MTRRIEEMETRMKEMEKEIEALREGPSKGNPATVEAPKEGTPLKVFYKDGIKLKSDEGDFDLSVGGRLIENGRFFTESNPNKDQFYNKETQIEMKGKVFKQFKYEFEGNFAGASAAMNNSFVEYERNGFFDVKVGQFKEPFLYEETSSTLWRDFAEKSIATRLAPSRDIGIQFSGKLFEKCLGYELACFNGAGKNASDTNDDKDWAARLTYTRNKLQVFAMGTWGRQDSAPASPSRAIASRPPRQKKMNRSQLSQ